MTTLFLVLLAGIVVGILIGLKMRGNNAATSAVQAPAVLPQAKVVAPSVLKDSWIAALGGANNIRAAQNVAATRVRVELQDGAKVNESALQQAGVQAIAAIDQQVFHLIVGTQSA